jgi:uncharacterized membrane protein YkvA (DUF1232 family)
MPRLRATPRTFLKARFLRFRREILVVAYALRDPGTPWHLKGAGLLLLAYLASPVDLVPIFVPVLGLVDDLLIVPWGLSRVVAALPEPARAASEARATRFIDRRIRKPLVFLAWLVAALLVLWALLLWIFWRLALGGSSLVS